MFTWIKHTIKLTENNMNYIFITKNKLPNCKGTKKHNKYYNKYV